MEKARMKIKVKYRGKWYFASSMYIDRVGNLSFEYLHDLYGCVDSEHVQQWEICKFCETKQENPTHKEQPNVPKVSVL